MNEQLPSKSNYEITRTKAIKALSALWDIAFPERSGERCQEWAETNHLCAIWDPDSLEDQQDAMPPGIWDLMLALGVTPAELIEHCHANPKLFEGSPTNETREQEPQPKDVGDLLMAITSLRQKAEDAEVLAKHVWDTATAQKTFAGRSGIQGPGDEDQNSRPAPSEKALHEQFPVQGGDVVPPSQPKPYKPL